MGGKMMEKNDRITKLGLSLEDAHWRNTIDMSLLRNNDKARRCRRRSQTETSDFDDLPTEEHSLNRITLLTPPTGVLASEVLGDQSDGSIAFKAYLSNAGKIPTPAHLQSCVDQKMGYKSAKSSIDQGRRSLLDGACQTEVEAIDERSASICGKLIRWSAKGSTWTVELLSAKEDKRFVCQRSGETPVFLSPEWTACLKSDRSEPTI